MRAVTLGLALAALLAVPASTHAQSEQKPVVPAVDDAAIFAMLERANNAEIELGELAARMGQSTEVRDLGKNFASAHTQARQKARDLAAKLGITPGKAHWDSTMKHDPMKAKNPADTLGKDRGYESSLNKLKGLKGTEFDVAFIAREIEHHTKMIDAVENKFIPSASNQELKMFLQQELRPSLQSHLDQARALEKKLALGQ